MGEAEEARRMIAGDFPIYVSTSMPADGFSLELVGGTAVGASVGWRAAINLRANIARALVLSEIRKTIAPDFAAIRARRAAVVDAGLWECERCNRNGCDGVIELEPVVDCACHLYPPCNACVEQVARCPECDWRSDEDAA
jgi:hypothetical protein